MSTDLDERLAATLKVHAGGDIDPAPMIERVRRRGRRRLRRRGFLTGGVIAICAALATAITMSQVPEVETGPVAALPDAPGQPGAAARPELVGTDPGVVHFTADALIAEAEYVTWSAGRGTESVEFRGPTGQARVVLARGSATLDALRQTLSSSGRPRPPTDIRVGDRPGTAWVDPPSAGSVEPSLWFVRWQPADGLWAQLDMYAATREEAIGAATRVRFDAARRCVVPFRLESLPGGARLLECSVKHGVNERDAFTEGTLVVGDESGRWLTVRAQRTPAGPEGRTGDLVAGPYRVSRQGSDVLEMYVKPCVVELFLKGWGRGYTEADGLSTMRGYRPAGDIDRPDTW